MNVGPQERTYVRECLCQIDAYGAIQPIADNLRYLIVDETFDETTEQFEDVRNDPTCKRKLFYVDHNVAFWKARAHHEVIAVEIELKFSAGRCLRELKLKAATCRKIRPPEVLERPVTYARSGNTLDTG